MHAPTLLMPRLHLHLPLNLIYSLNTHLSLTADSFIYLFNSLRSNTVLVYRNHSSLVLPFYQSWQVSHPASNYTFFSIPTPFLEHDAILQLGLLDRL